MPCQKSCSIVCLITITCVMSWKIDSRGWVARQAGAGAGRGEGMGRLPSPWGRLLPWGPRGPRGGNWGNFGGWLWVERGGRGGAADQKRRNIRGGSGKTGGFYRRAHPMRPDRGIVVPICSPRRKVRQKAAPYMAHRFVPMINRGSTAICVLRWLWPIWDLGFSPEAPGPAPWTARLPRSRRFRRSE